MAGEPRYTEPMNVMVTTDVRAYLDVLGERERHRSMGESARHLIDLGIELDRVLQQRRAAGLPTNVLELARLEAEAAPRRRGRAKAVEPVAKPCVVEDAGVTIEAEQSQALKAVEDNPFRAPAPEGIDTSTLSRAQRRRLGLPD